MIGNGLIIGFFKIINTNIIFIYNNFMYLFNYIINSIKIILISPNRSP